MKIGQNSPQIYQYPVSLFYGEASEFCDDAPSKFTPQDLQKVIERERSRIELLAGNFIFSGFNIWTTQKLEETF